jgi:hypothetical protein
MKLTRTYPESNNQAWASKLRVGMVVLSGRISDPEARERTVPSLLEEKRQIREAKKPRHIQVARGSEEARASSSVFQTGVGILKRKVTTKNVVTSAWYPQHRVDPLLLAAMPFADRTKEQESKSPPLDSIQARMLSLVSKQSALRRDHRMEFSSIDNFVEESST